MNRETVSDVLQQYPEASPEQIGQALCLYAAGVCHFDQDTAQYVIEAYEDLPGAYVKSGTCSCVDDPFDSSAAACPHLLAVAMVHLENHGGHEGSAGADMPAMAVAPVPALPERLTLVHDEPLSCTIKGYSAKGFDTMFTARGLTVEELMGKVKALYETMERYHFRPTMRPVQDVEMRQTAPQQETPDPQGQPQAPVVTQPAPAPPQQAAPQQAPAPAQYAPAGALSFAAQTLEVEKRANGNEYGKVKGGRFSKHGVNCWPEVWQAAGIAIQAPCIVSLQGWTAEYIEANGKPDKVTRLVRG